MKKLILLLLIPLAANSQVEVQGAFEQKATIGQLEYKINSSIENMFGLPMSMYRLNYQDSTIHMLFFDGNVVGHAWQNLASAPYQEFHSMEGSDFARIGYGTYNDYKHGVTVTNSQVIINGSGNTILDVSDSQFNPVLTVKTSGVFFEAAPVLKSQNGTLYKLKVDNNGVLSTEPF